MELGKRFLLLTVILLSLLVATLPSLARADVYVNVFSTITFDHQTIEQNESVTITYAMTVTPIVPIREFYFLSGFAEVTVSTPSGKTYSYFAERGPSVRLSYPKDFGGSTDEIGNYSVHVYAGGLVGPVEAIVRDEKDGYFTVVPKGLWSASSFFLIPTLLAVALSILGLAGYGLLVRAGLVRERGVILKLQSTLSRFNFLTDFRIWMPVLVVIVILSAVIFPIKIIPILVLTLIIAAAWVSQTALSIYFSSKLYPHYVRGSAYYIFGWMSVALHEISHAIVSIIFGARIKRIHITAEEGFVEPVYRDNSFRTWCGRVFGGLAPAYFIPAILLLVWFLSFGMKLSLPHKPLTEDIYTPFNKFVFSGLVNFLYWIVINFSNPFMYIYMYFLVCSSIAAGPSPPFQGREGWRGDWLFVLQTVKSMPKHTLTFILVFLSIMSLLALVNYDILVGFLGFWLLLYVVVFFSLIIALIFTRLTLRQGIALIIIAIVLNGLAGYIITAWTPIIQHWQSSFNP